MAKVIIFGITEIARVSHYYFTHDSPHEVVAFTVNQKYIKENTFCGLPVIPFEEIESIYPPDDHKMFVAILFGRVNKKRAEIYYQAKAKRYELVSYISSKAFKWDGLVVGDNCFIAECSNCQPFTTIGNDVFIMNSCSVGHDSVIKDHCFLAAHSVVLGLVTVEPYCFIGANSTIRNDVTIARECIIGAGAVILKDTKEKQVYQGATGVLLPFPSDKLLKI